MELNNINTSGVWANIVSLINNNFYKINIAISQLISKTSNNKGYFSTIENLQSKYPIPLDGWFAWVGSPFPGTVYNVVGGAWVNTQNIPALESVDLSEYAKRNETLISVDIAASSADFGAILVKDGHKWVHVLPTETATNDYDNMLLPVYHSASKKWMFIKASSITSDNEADNDDKNNAFPYTFPFKLK